MADETKTMGRPTKYLECYDAIARNYCEFNAATDADLARLFGVDRSCISVWKNSHPTFMSALINGKDMADEVVVRKLYERATGYKGKGEKVLNDGNVVEYDQYVIPDVTACIFWLKNRRPKEWRDVHKLDLAVDDQTAQAVGNAIKTLVESGVLPDPDRDPLVE